MQLNRAHLGRVAFISMVFFLIAVLANPDTTNSADLNLPPIVPPVEDTVLFPYPARRIISELRLGIAAHSLSGEESGSVNFNGEILFGKFFQADNPVVDVLIPRLHIGGSLNTAGHTSFIYTGLTWDYTITEALFIEASFGGAIHNNDKDKVASSNHDLLGCSPLFRESAAIGYRFSNRWLLMAMVEHMSNAGLCRGNRGQTNAGMKIGYNF